MQSLRRSSRFTPRVQEALVLVECEVGWAPESAWHVGKENNFLPLPTSQPRPFGCPSCTLASTVLSNLESSETESLGLNCVHCTAPDGRCVCNNDRILPVKSKPKCSDENFPRFTTNFHMEDQSIDPEPTDCLTNDTLQLPSILQDTSYCALRHANYAEWEFRSTGHNVLSVFNSSFCKSSGSLN